MYNRISKGLHWNKDARSANLKHLASWISGISIRYFKGTNTVQLPCMYYTLSLLQTKLAEKSIVSKTVESNGLTFNEETRGYPWGWHKLNKF